MNRQNLMDQAQKIVTLYACRGLEEQKCEEMTRWVERFFRDHVSRLSRSEIMGPACHAHEGPALVQRLPVQYGKLSLLQQSGCRRRHLPVGRLTGESRCES